MNELLKMLNDRYYGDSILDKFLGMAKNQDTPDFYQTVLNALIIDQYYAYSDDHRDWVLGVAQDKIKAHCEMMLRGV